MSSLSSGLASAMSFKTGLFGNGPIGVGGEVVKEGGAAVSVESSAVTTPQSTPTATVPSSSSSGGATKRLSSLYRSASMFGNKLMSNQSDDTKASPPLHFSTRPQILTEMSSQDQNDNDSDDEDSDGSNNVVVDRGPVGMVEETAAFRVGLGLGVSTEGVVVGSKKSGGSLASSRTASPPPFSLPIIPDGEPNEDSESVSGDNAAAAVVLPIAGDAAALAEPDLDKNNFQPLTPSTPIDGAVADILHSISFDDFLDPTDDILRKTLRTTFVLSVWLCTCTVAYELSSSICRD